MKMEEEFSGSTDQIIVKRKRTKRQRSSSSTSSTDFHNSSSPTTSISAISTSREEDEDMANCLILLARGNNSPPPPPPERKKSGSRKFTEMSTSAAEGKIGIYVYECKTCNRTFPSFQALGGHRASHKKPKSTADYDPKNSTPPPRPSILPDHQSTITPPPSIPQLPNKTCDNLNKHKIHECAICGSEFGSGQALGGHMRRHRPVPPIVATSSSNDSSSSPKNVFGLDLNLPAPIEDEKFHQFPALVDCHY